ncbi:MAG: four helix bundle protein [Verrucomicrobia bacterium]|nr:four helix bundle protein [Verrucomicrobiota bacterium]
MNFNDWLKSVPPSITADSLWKMQAYRVALFFGDIAWRDVTKLHGDRRTISLSDQLYRALGSIGANLAEGYSRGTGKDRARFYEYALGSTRESRDWYFKGRFVLGEKVASHRLELLSQIIRLLLRMVPEQRGDVLREAPAAYRVDSTPAEASHTEAELEALLREIPFAEPPS